MTPTLLPERVDEIAIGHPPPPPVPRPRVLFMGTALALGGVVMAFAALLAVYLSERNAASVAGREFLPEGAALPITPAQVGLATLLLSLFMVQWAVHAIAHDDRPRAYLALGLTALLGGAYLNGMAFGFSQYDIGLRSRYGMMFYALMGSHMAMAAVGVVFVGLMAFRTLGGQYSGRDREGIAAAAIYWYVTVFVYAILWYTIFLKK
ncbi:MAG: cytochrome c oxidase subunit 3 [Acidimicrobiia bacterium]